MKIFDPILKFLDSLAGYLSYNDIFVIFVGLFLITMLLVMITTSKAYESRLIKAIDKFNNYFVDNPNITEENLVVFNQKMKSKKVPKQLRKQWQQFVLYREEKASYYMSFENCVTKPIKNSSFKRDVTILNILAHVYAILCFVLNLFFSFEVDNLSVLLQHVLLGPAFILLLNSLVRIFLEVRHNAIVSDLHQNYQYFEANIDKATKTLPEYVDYEVLFDRNEIKKGIPILYTYLQKRAEAEQRELDLARLKNIEHEQFNFDEAGVAGSLVLERAMQEAENYIAERKKYNQDTEQINTDITQEEMNYREITKEYNRQMQVSRETFENFKAQLNDVSSTIEANYLKKQQQQELDRQRNLERDFDTHTERHKKVLESFQQELDSVDQFRAQSRKALEDAMMSEFKSYNNKVFLEAKKQAEEQQQEKFDKIKEQMKELEEKIVAQNKELENVYAENQELSEKLVAQQEELEAEEAKQSKKKKGKVEEPIQEEPVEETAEEIVEQEPVQPEEQPNEDLAEESVVEETPVEETPVEETIIEESPEEEPVQEAINNQGSEQEEAEGEDVENIIENLTEEQFNEMFPKTPIEQLEAEVNNKKSLDEQSEEGEDEDIDFEKFFDESEESGEDEEDEGDNEEPLEITDEELEAFFADEEIEDEEENKQEESTNAVNSTEQKEESKVAQPGEIVEQPKKRAGRPRKVRIEEPDKKPKKRGRPKKEKVEQPAKRKVGRPKKVKVEEVKAEPKKRRGRPKKVVAEAVKTEPKRKVGRPRKEKTVTPTKKRVGRPRKAEVKAVETKKKVGRPKKVKVEEVKVEAKKRGRPRKEKVEQPVVKRRGRPRKTETSNSVDFDAYLKEIDNAIAKENEKIKKTTKQLEKKARISKRKK